MLLAKTGPIVDWLIEIQRWLYGGMGEGMRTTADVSAAPALMVGALFFGMAHALMPGHGKSVLVSYHLGRLTRILEGIATGTLLSLTHVGIAVVFVLGGIAVISRSLAVPGRAPAFEAFSAALITIIGIYLLFRAIRPPAHMHARDGRTLAVATGLVPCPLTTFILSYALTHNKLGIGLAAVVAMLGVVVVTITGFAMAAIIARQRFVTFLDRSEEAGSVDSG